MMSNINNKKDLLLLLLYSPGKSNRTNEPIAGRTRLVKMLYIFKMEVLQKFKKGTEITEDNFYEFFPWDFGPFSKQVYDDLNFFILRDFICILNSDQEGLPEAAEEWANYQQDADFDENFYSEYEEEKFKLTNKGVNFTKKLYNELSQNQKNILQMFKSKFSSTSLRAILEYVYNTYPDTITKSVIKNRILY